MQAILQYLIPVHIYALVLLLIYRICLRNQVANGWSRIYLWAVAVLPFVLPLLTLPQFVQQSAVYKDNISLMLPEVVPGGAAPRRAMSINIIVLLYSAIAGLLLLRMVWKLYRFYRLVRQNGYEQDGRYRMVYRAGMAPGSFLQYILLPGRDVPADVVRHEQAHIDRGHAYDMIALELVQCLGFCNLLLPLIRKELKLVHEFEADRLAATDTGAYAALLVREGLHLRSAYTYHSFFTHPIKRRIMMLHKKSTLSGIRKIGVVALLAGLCLAGISLQSPTRAAAPDVVTPEKEEEVFRSVEVAPKADFEWSKYLQEHLEIPASAAGKKYNYRFYISFIVEKDGTVSNVKTVSSKNGNEQIPVDEALIKDFEVSALNAIKSMPAWTPGYQKGQPVRCYFTVPVKFIAE